MTTDPDAAGIETVNGESTAGARAIPVGAAVTDSTDGPWRALGLVGAVFCAVLLVEYAGCGWLGAAGSVRPHPYWLPVLWAAIGFGFVAGAGTGLLAAGLWVFGAFQRGVFAEFADLWAAPQSLEPLAFVVLGALLGELRSGARRRERALHRAVLQIHADRQRVRSSADEARRSQRRIAARLQFDALGFSDLLTLAARLREREDEPAELALELLVERCAVTRAAVVRMPEAPARDAGTDDPAEGAGRAELLFSTGIPRAEQADFAARCAVDPVVELALESGAFVDSLRPDGRVEPMGAVWATPLRIDAETGDRIVLCVDALDPKQLSDRSAVDARAIAAWCEVAWRQSLTQAGGGELDGLVILDEDEQDSAAVADWIREIGIDPEHVFESGSEPRDWVEEHERWLQRTRIESADQPMEELARTPADVSGWFETRDARAGEEWAILPLKRPLPTIDEFDARVQVERIRAEFDGLAPAVLVVDLPMDLERLDAKAGIEGRAARDAVRADVALEVFGRGLRSTDGLFLGERRDVLRVLLPATNSAGAYIVRERLLRLARMVSPMLAGSQVRVVEDDDRRDPAVPEVVGDGRVLAARLGREWHLARRHRRDLHVVHLRVRGEADSSLGRVRSAVLQALERPFEELYQAGPDRLTVVLPGADGLRAYAVHDALEEAAAECLDEGSFELEVFSLGSEGPEYQPFLARVLQ